MRRLEELARLRNLVVLVLFPLECDCCPASYLARRRSGDFQESFGALPEDAYCLRSTSGARLYSRQQDCDDGVYVLVYQCCEMLTEIVTSLAVVLKD